jgi:hypothetical protein
MGCLYLHRLNCRNRVVGLWLIRHGRGGIVDRFEVSSRGGESLRFLFSSYMQNLFNEMSTNNLFLIYTMCVNYSDLDLAMKTKLEYRKKLCAKKGNTV